MKERERRGLCLCVHHIPQGRSWFTGCCPLDKKIQQFVCRLSNWWVPLLKPAKTWVSFKLGVTHLDTSSLNDTRKKQQNQTHFALMTTILFMRVCVNIVVLAVLLSIHSHEKNEIITFISVTPFKSWNPFAADHCLPQQMLLYRLVT